MVNVNDNTSIKSHTTLWLDMILVLLDVSSYKKDYLFRKGVYIEKMYYLAFNNFLKKLYVKGYTIFYHKKFL